MEAGRNVARYEVGGLILLEAARALALVASIGYALGA
jgi:hypothetical protein